jgi:hypothetical protein
VVIVFDFVKSDESVTSQLAIDALGGFESDGERYDRIGHQL